MTIRHSFFCDTVTPKTPLHSPAFLQRIQMKYSRSIKQFALKVLPNRGLEEKEKDR
jgi:hypothetical protein